jgi:SET domain-containing protein
MKHEVENKYLDFKKSNIHNLGAYAARDIRKGTRIIEYIGQAITKKKAAKELQDGNGYVFTINKFFDIDGSVQWNPARYINHGCAANAESDIIKDRVWIIAARTIRKGEEVLYNYNYDLEDAFDNPCRCGAENCVGYIVGDEFWPKLRRLIKKRGQK